MNRLTRSDETALRTKIANGTATMLEMNLLGEIVHLRRACFDYAERLGVAWPKQVADLQSEAAKIVTPPWESDPAKLREQYHSGNGHVDPPGPLEQRAIDGDR